MGAWIETRKNQSQIACQKVAPRVGAWIETDCNKGLLQLGESRPAWARGLKHSIINNYVTRPSRAPRGRVD